jgi:hypothetical protein
MDPKSTTGSTCDSLAPHRTLDLAVDEVVEVIRSGREGD